MTDYTTITDTQVDPEAPITSELMSALRDNPIAITEGASGAPQVQRAAIQDAAVNSSKISFGTRSFSGTAFSGTSVSISLSDNYAFVPVITTLQQGANLEFFQGGYRVSNPTGENRNYAFSWRYIA